MSLRLKINGEYELDGNVWVNAALKYTQGDYKHIVVEKIRERYSIDEEFAVQRQRYTKAEEFEEYNSYCEECKAWARGICNIKERGV